MYSWYVCTVSHVCVHHSKGHHIEFAGTSHTFLYMSSCVGKQITEVRRLMTGVEGSVVELQFVGLRNGKKETVSVSLKRQPPPKIAR